MRCFLTGIKTRAELEAISAANETADRAGAVFPEENDRSGLPSPTDGVRIALQGHAPFAAATLAVYETLKALPRRPRLRRNLTGPCIIRVDGAASRATPM